LGTRLAFTETAYDEDQPQLALRMPEGTLMIPLMLNVNYEIVPGTASHLIWSTTTNDIGDGTSTELAVVNYRRDNKYAATVKARSKYTANATAATGLIEVRRFYHPYAAAAVTDAEPKHMPWSINDPDMPVLLGPATIQGRTRRATASTHGWNWTRSRWVCRPDNGGGLRSAPYIQREKPQPQFMCGPNLALRRKRNGRKTRMALE